MTETVPVVVEAPAVPAVSAAAWGTPKSLTEALQMAELVAGSDIVPQAYRGKPGNVLVAMQMGAELGLAPMAALQNIAVVNGRPSLWGDAPLALCKRHSRWGWIKESDDGETATCTVKRRGEPEVTHTFSMDDAKLAGLLSKDSPWRTYPKRMRQMRARGFALRDAFPDALRGLAIAEEAADMPRQIEHEDVTPEPQGATATEKLKNKMAKRKAAPPASEQAPPPLDRAALDARFNVLVKAAAQGDEEKHARILDDLDSASQKKHGVPVDGLDDEKMAKLVEGLEAQAR